MASKRTRAAFEADLQAQQSPYVLYGTALPPIDPDVRDDGSYVPVWKQEVTDEQGRKRLHGAFTGGFSAGYFNTVGSKDGWTPSNFVSSRSNRNKDAPKTQQRPEDFMDEEDLAEAEAARQVQVNDAFAGLGSNEDTQNGVASIMDVFRPSGDSIGIRLLRKLGWREGQGVGPKVRRKAMLDTVDGGKSVQSHLFAPKNSAMVTFDRKNDKKGLGFESERPINSSSGAADHEDSTGADSLGSAQSTGVVPKKSTKVKERKGAIGVGVLNDTGSDDEDPYAIGPAISYNRIIGGDKKKKKTKQALAASTANPMLGNKPIYKPHKYSTGKGGSGFQRCHDGRLPLDGFVLSTILNGGAAVRTDLHGNEFIPPQVPEGWISSKAGDHVRTSQPTEYQSTAEVASMSNLSPKSRAALLGEAQLPGKSVFDYLSQGARSKIARATNNEHLPPALNEAINADSLPSDRSLRSLVQHVDPRVAKTALDRGKEGWMPYSEDLSKQSRYRDFLEYHASSVDDRSLPGRASGVNNDEWAKEMAEFAHAADIFKPVSGSMANRFVSSSRPPQPASDRVDSSGRPNDQEDGQLLRIAAQKVKTPAEEAAAMNMYGRLTRTTEPFYPSRLLCKRMNIKPPAHVQQDSDDIAGQSGKESSTMPTHSDALPQRRLELVGKQDMDELKHNLNHYKQSAATFDNQGTGSVIDEPQVLQSRLLIDPERNEALERDRPEEAVFKAIFGDDDDDESG